MPGLVALLGGAQRVMLRAIMQRLDDAGVVDLRPGDAVGLSVLALRSLTAGEIAALLGVSKQAVSQVVDRLERSGYLSSRPDPLDRRRLLLVLTPQGRAAATVVATARQAVEDELAARIGAERVALLRETLELLVASLGDAGQVDGEGGPAPA